MIRSLPIDWYWGPKRVSKFKYIENTFEKSFIQELQWYNLWDYYAGMLTSVYSKLFKLGSPDQYVWDPKMQISWMFIIFFEYMHIYICWRLEIGKQQRKLMTKNVHEIITRKQMYMTKLPSMTSGRRIMRALIKNFLKVYTIRHLYADHISTSPRIGNQIIRQGISFTMYFSDRRFVGEAWLMLLPSHFQHSKDQ